jgi:hypothetical protein
MEKHATQPEHTLPSIKDGLSKQEIRNMASQSVDQVLEEGNVFKVAEALAAMEEFVKTVRKDERFVQFLRDELAKYHGKLVTASGARIESCEAGVSYNYSHHAEWREVDEELKRLTEKKKMIEEKLKVVGPGRMAVDTETGEVVEGASKTSRSTYRITLSR